MFIRYNLLYLRVLKSTINKFRNKKKIFYYSWFTFAHFLFILYSLTLYSFRTIVHRFQWRNNMGEYWYEYNNSDTHKFSTLLHRTGKVSKKTWILYNSLVPPISSGFNVIIHISTFIYIFAVVLEFLSYFI